MVMVSSISRPVVLTRMVASPAIVTPFTPRMETVPVAWRANVSAFESSLSLIRPTEAPVRSAPRASGLNCPSASRSGPSPMKSSRSSPAKVLAVRPVPFQSEVPDEKETLPAMLTKSPIFSVRSETETSKSMPSPDPKATLRSRPPKSIVSSSSIPVLLILSAMLPPASTGPSAPRTRPLRNPAIPPSFTTNAPLPSANWAVAPASSTVAPTLVAPIRVRVSTEPSGRVTSLSSTKKFPVNEMPLPSVRVSPPRVRSASTASTLT